MKPSAIATTLVSSLAIALLAALPACSAGTQSLGNNLDGGEDDRGQGGRETSDTDGPDQGRMSIGVPAGAKRIFVTSTRYSGNLGGVKVPMRSARS